MKTLLVLILAAAAFAAGVYLGPRVPHPWASPTGEATAAPADGERKPIKYRHPMNPTIFSDTPAKDDMGMDYIPVYADEGGGMDATVRISPTLVNNLGVRTAPVTRAMLSRRIDTVGYLDYDERRISHVHVRTPGWVESLKVRAVGERVSRGDLLFEFYSPELSNAQEEFLLAARSGQGRLITGARDRLLALGLSEGQLRQLEQQRRVHQLSRVYARQDGVVSQLMIREGMYVRPDSEIMTLVDLSSIWVLVDVFEQQAAWVRVGQKAEVTLPYLPGEVWKGEVEHIYPDLDPRTRTLKARLHFPNPDERLMPNMFANVSIHADPREALSFPREALILDGGGARVMVDRGEGRYEAVTIEPGIESGDRVEVRSGLAEGDRVVVSAQFLLDSEASLKASILRMSQAEAPAIEPALTGRGTVNAVHDDGLNITHAPIPALGWPQMTMDFALAPGVDGATVAPETAVGFELGRGEDGRYRITRIWTEEERP